MLRNRVHKITVTPLLLLSLLLIFGGCGAATPTATPAATSTTLQTMAIPANLAGTPWKLVSYGPASTPTAALPKPAITLEFEQNGKISGSAGCNGYFSTATITGEQLQLGSVGNTAIGCVDQAIADQERAFLDALYEAQTIALVDATLTITYPAGQLIFTHP